jgi:hypothetical protein
VGAEGIGDSDHALLIADDAATFAATVIQAYTDPEKWSEAQHLSFEVIRKYFSKESARSILRQDMPL